MRLISTTFPVLASIALFLSVSPLHADNHWYPVGQEANDVATKEHKLVLQVFKRCNWADQWSDLVAHDSYLKLDKEVFATPAFQKFARQHLILQLLDYSKGVKYDDKTQQELHQSLLYWQPAIKVYPTLILHDPKWVELGRKEGYLTGQSAEIMAWLHQLVAQAASTSHP